MIVPKYTSRNNIFRPLPSLLHSHTVAARTGMKSAKTGVRWYPENRNMLAIPASSAIKVTARNRLSPEFRGLISNGSPDRVRCQIKRVHTPAKPAITYERFEYAVH